MFKKYFWAVLGVVVMLIAALLFFLFSGKFYVKNAEVLGKNTFTPKQLMDIGGIDPKKNIYLINTGSAEKNLLKNPYIESIVIGRKFPDTLTFSIRERVEVASLPISGGYAVIDSKGVMLRLVHDASKAKKPMIRGIKLKDGKIGERLKFEDEPKAYQFLEIIDISSSLGLLEGISYISFEKPASISMTTVTGIDVLFGNSDDLQYKIKFLNKILVDLQSRGKMSGTVDFRYNSDPVFRENVPMKDIMDDIPADGETENKNTINENPKANKEQKEEETTKKEVKKDRENIDNKDKNEENTP